uniref:BPTI/Kunitz inhibitor domain-containing protein n=1 Tax=Acrobeloides nanus TaxID=290746 RepID=A0A914E443_9BILA
MLEILAFPTTENYELTSTIEYKTLKPCIDQFDEKYRNECNGGQWKQHYYYDRSLRTCIAFWYDGCSGTSQNIFQDDITCIDTCEKLANEIDLAYRQYLRKKFQEEAKNNKSDSKSSENTGVGFDWNLDQDAGSASDREEFARNP